MVKKFFLLLSLCLSAQAKVILWDLGGVLFYPDKIGVARAVGLSHFVSYMVLDFSNPNIQHKLFEVLELMARPEPGVREKAGTAEGDPLPTIMCQWQAGTVKGPDIIKRSIPHLSMLNSIGYFESKRERRLMQRTIRAMFDPQILADNIYPLEKGVELLKECKEATDKDGNIHRNFAFSNWDPLSFDIFKEKNLHIFNLFDEIVISGHIKCIKPRKEAFKYLLETYHLDPERVHSDR